MAEASTNDALRIVKESPNDAHFTGPVPESLVLKAEAILGVGFPMSYRRFLKTLGSGSFKGRDFFGLIDEHFELPNRLDMMRVTCDARKSFGLRDDLLIVGSTGFGPYYAIDLSRSGANGEPIIVDWFPDHGELPKISEDFGTFFLKSVE